MAAVVVNRVKWRDSDLACVQDSTRPPGGYHNSVACRFQFLLDAVQQQMVAGGNALRLLGVA